jgi:flotillin
MDTVLLIAIGGLVLLILFLVIFIVSRIKVAGPNEAFIITGRKGKSVQGLDGSR